MIAKRTDDGTTESDEIRDLVETAGHEVVGEVTQTRTDDPAT